MMGNPAGPVAHVPARDVLYRRLEASDREHEHLWVMTAAWRVSDPQTYATGRAPVLLDGESLVMVSGPGCFKCEQPWTRKRAAQPCPVGWL